MSLQSTVTNLIVGVLEDERVQQWVDTRITNALNTQRDEIFGKIEASGASVINELNGSINATETNLTQNLTQMTGTIGQSVASLSQGLGGLSGSIVGAVVSQIKGIIPFHLLPGPQGKTGR